MKKKHVRQQWTDVEWAAVLNAALAISFVKGFVPSVTDEKIWNTIQREAGLPTHRRRSIHKQPNLMGLLRGQIKLALHNVGGQGTDVLSNGQKLLAAKKVLDQANDKWMGTDKGPLAHYEPTEKVNPTQAVIPSRLLEQLFPNLKFTQAFLVIPVGT